MKKLGFVGLGIMGSNMAANLVRKFDGVVCGFDIVESARQHLCDIGGEAVTDASVLYRESDVIFLSLPTNELVERTVRDILECARPGTIVLDMGSTAPSLIRQLCRLAEAQGCHLLDCPVSGGVDGAINGTLTIMCGGDRAIFEEMCPYLEMMGSTITYMGAAGCGDVAKLANNMIVGANLAALCEAVAFAAKDGIDLEALFEAVRGGSAQSAVMDTKMPKLLKGDYEVQARMRIHRKDIVNALTVANELQVELPLTALIKQQMDYIYDNGMIDEDQIALIKYYEHSMRIDLNESIAENASLKREVISHYEQQRA